MKKYIAIGIAALLSIGVLVALADSHLPSTDERLANIEGTLGIVYPTFTPEATATDVPPTATATTPPATATEEPLQLGWHPAGSHNGLNVHEHGDEPPAWVEGAFTQVRESHTGYKGAYAVSPGGVESYLVAHIISTAKARSHGDHDYQLWLRDPETGEIHYEEGVLCFAEPCAGVPPERTSDTGERPIILSVNDGACETWYSDPGSNLMDIGWTICGRYENFAGDVLGGVGTFRTVDWIIPCNRLPAGSPFLDNCRVEFTVSRLSFLVNSRDYSAPGISPIN